MAFDVNEKYIISTEEKLKIRFPKSYRESMMKNNGGLLAIGDIEETDYCGEIIPVLDSSEKSRLKRTCEDIIRENNLAWEEYGLPHNLVAIASDNGAYFVFKKSENGILENAVYFIDPSGDIVKVADDFSELNHCD